MYSISVYGGARIMTMIAGVALLQMEAARPVRLESRGRGMSLYCSK